ncbi:flagellar basal body rod protein FlgC [Halovulum sp. GXIMD14794]
MSDLIKIMASSASGMAAQGARLRVVSENIANADTPGYRRKLVPFEKIALGQGTGGVRAGRVDLDRSELERIHNPDHPLAGDDGMYEGSNVKLMVELADAREAQRSYQANLRMFDQARKMTSSVLDLLRR